MLSLIIKVNTKKSRFFFQLCFFFAHVLRHNLTTLRSLYHSPVTLSRISKNLFIANTRKTLPIFVYISTVFEIVQRSYTRRSEERVLISTLL